MPVVLPTGAWILGRVHYNQSMTKYARVALSATVDRTFDYHIPPQLADRVPVGGLVRVAFGTAQQPAIVVGLSTQASIEQTKPILELYDPEPVVSAKQIALAEWLAARYVCPLGMALWEFLPPGLTARRDVRVRLRTDAPTGEPPAGQGRLLDLLRRRGTLTGEQITRALKGAGWRRGLDALRRGGWIETESMLHAPRAKPQKIQVAALNIAPEHVDHARGRLGKRTRLTDSARRLLDACDDAGGAISTAAALTVRGVGAATLDSVLDSGVMVAGDDGNLYPAPDAEARLFALRGGETDERILRVLAREGGAAMDVSWVYAQAGAELADLKRLAEAGLIVIGEQENIRDPLADTGFAPVSPPRLTDDQTAAWVIARRAIEADDVAQKTVLLHGVTGSGKTEIYLRAVAHVLDVGRAAYLLVPEIALTAQMIRRVLARFSPERTAIVHSGLTDGQRYDTWRRARAGEIDLVVGTRAALFTPLPDVGLIVLDEEHDQSYKSPDAPRYHLREVAGQMARIHDAALILGSATPDSGTRYRAERGEIAYAKLPKRIMGHRVRVDEQAARYNVESRYEAMRDDALTIPLPAVDVVDMRDELKAGNVSIFSRALEAALTETLRRGEQAILFLNRRGTSTYVFCRDCGAVALCPRCDTTLTYHAHAADLHCHHCGYRGAPPEQCGSCGSKRVRYFGAGTQQVEEAFKAAFPAAVALRWDRDTARTAGDHDMILSRFTAGQADVLIGTQMIAKGLDLPLVTLVGVVSADVGLNLPDFRAEERTFQVLSQVAGRAGRGVKGGRVILQTYQPEHPVIRYAAAHDYDGFYAQTIAGRREMGYPPFRRIVRIVFSDAQAHRVKQSAEDAFVTLRGRRDELEMTGTEINAPVPCFYGRLNGLYRWQIVLRGPEPSRIFAGFAVPRGWQIDVDPADML